MTTIDRHVGSKTKADVDTLARELRNWGRWGADDEAGTLNFNAATNVAAAAKLVRTGEIISMAVPFGPSGPQNGNFGRFNPILSMFESGTDDYDAASVFDAVGRPRPRLLRAENVQRLSDESRRFARSAKDSVVAYKEKLAGRGVLLDIARAASNGSRMANRSIPNLDKAVERAGVSVGEGDFVLVRTGQTGWCRRYGWGAYAPGDAPGLSLDTARWLFDKRVAAVAVDTWGAEVRPNESYSTGSSARRWETRG